MTRNVGFEGKNALCALGSAVKSGQSEHLLDERNVLAAHLGELLFAIVRLVG